MQQRSAQPGQPQQLGPSQPASPGAGQQWQNQQTADAVSTAVSTAVAGPYQTRNFSVGEAFNWGWLKTFGNFGTIALAALGYLVVGALLYGLFWVIFMALGLGMGSSSTASNDPHDLYAEQSSSALANSLSAGLVITLVLYYVVFLIYTFMVQAGITRGALTIAAGRPLTFGTMFSFQRIGTVIVAAILIAVLVSIGTVACIVPGLIIQFFSIFTIFFIVDKGMGPVAAIKASFAFVNRNVGSLVGLYIGFYIAVILGLLACGIGIIIAIPASILAQTFAYRTLQGQLVAR